VEGKVSVLNSGEIRGQVGDAQILKIDGNILRA